MYEKNITDEEKHTYQVENELSKGPGTDPWDYAQFASNVVWTISYRKDRQNHMPTPHSSQCKSVWLNRKSRLSDAIKQFWTIDRKHYLRSERGLEKTHEVDLERRMKLIPTGNDSQLIFTLPVGLSTIWTVQHLDRDRSCCANSGCSAERSNIVNLSIRLRRLGIAKQIDNKFEVDPSSAGSIVIVLTKALRSSRVCCSVR